MLLRFHLCFSFSALLSVAQKINVLEGRQGEFEIWLFIFWLLMMVLGTEDTFKSGNYVIHKYVFSGGSFLDGSVDLSCETRLGTRHL